MGLAGQNIPGWWIFIGRKGQHSPSMVNNLRLKLPVPRSTLMVKTYFTPL